MGEPQQLIYHAEDPDLGLFRRHAGDAGFDLPVLEGGTAWPGCLTEFRSGIRVATPGDVWLRVTGRSSTVRRFGLLVVDGVIDSGYRGELVVAVWNLTPVGVAVERGQRLGQVVPHRRLEAEAVGVPGVLFDGIGSVDGRGVDGYGSTGR